MRMSPDVNEGRPLRGRCDTARSPHMLIGCKRVCICVRRCESLRLYMAWGMQAYEWQASAPHTSTRRMDRVSAENSHTSFLA